MGGWPTDNRDAFMRSVLDEMRYGVGDDADLDPDSYDVIETLEEQAEKWAAKLMHGVDQHHRVHDVEFETYADAETLRGLAHDGEMFDERTARLWHEQRPEVHAEAVRLTVDEIRVTLARWATEEAAEEAAKNAA